MCPLQGRGRFRFLLGGDGGGGGGGGGVLWVSGGHVSEGAGGKTFV